MQLREVVSAFTATLALLTTLPRWSPFQGPAWELPPPMRPEPRPSCLRACVCAGHVCLLRAEGLQVSLVFVMQR